MHREDVFLSCDGQIEAQPTEIPDVPAESTGIFLLILFDDCLVSVT